MISLRRVVKTYSSPAGDFPALRGIDLELGAGQLIALVASFWPARQASRAPVSEALAYE